MLKNIKLSTLQAAACIGGFIGWYYTVMYICKISLHFYNDETLLHSVNETFLITAVITLALLTGLLCFLDIEGLLYNKLLRWLPGIFMAESGIALSLANFSTMTAFSSIAGVAYAFGALAVFSSLLKVKVGQRLISIGLGMALGGLIRLLASWVLSSASPVVIIVVAVAVGIIAAATVHSDGYSKKGAPTVSLAEAGVSTILKNIPLGYISIFLCVAVFYFSQTRISSIISANLPHSYEIFEYVSYAGFIIAAVIIAFFFRFQHLPMLFGYGTAAVAAASFLIGLPNLTFSETTIFALLFYAGIACIRACLLLYIVVFSLDRAHPLFYAIFGYAVVICAELIGTAISNRVTIDPFGYCLLLVLLAPIGGWIVSRLMRGEGFTNEKLEHRHILHQQITEKCAELEFFERETMMIESIVLEGCDIAELSERMLFSRNTVKVLLRNPLAKLGLKDENEVRSYFEDLADSVELAATAEREQIAAERRAIREEERRLKNEERDRREEELRRKYLEKQALAAAKADAAELEKSKAEETEAEVSENEVSETKAFETEAAENSDTDIPEEVTDGTAKNNGITDDAKDDGDCADDNATDEASDTDDSTDATSEEDDTAESDADSGEQNDTASDDDAQPDNADNTASDNESDEPDTKETPSE